MSSSVVSWDDDIPIWKNKIHVPNHQPDSMKSYLGDATTIVSPEILASQKNLRYGSPSIVIYPLVNVYINIWKITICSWENARTKWWFSILLCKRLPKGMGYAPKMDISWVHSPTVVDSPTCRWFRTVLGISIFGVPYNVPSSNLT